jgi:hypothetical protein
MIKRVASLLAVLALIAGSSYGGTITWGYLGDLGGGYTAGWLVELIEDVNGNGIGIGGIAGSGSVLYDDRSFDQDDAFVGTPVTTTLQSGKTGTGWGTTFGAPGSTLALSDSVYTVIYNAASFAAATQYQVIDSSPYTLPASDIDAAYTVTSVSGSWAPIVPVPEPGSIALFALGLVTLAARRKRR